MAAPNQDQMGAYAQGYPQQQQQTFYQQGPGMQQPQQQAPYYQPQMAAQQQQQQQQYYQPQQQQPQQQQPPFFQPQNAFQPQYNQPQQQPQQQPGMALGGNLLQPGGVGGAVLGAYQFLGNVQNNVSSNFLIRYVTGNEFQQYFNVTPDYVRDKLFRVLFPFLVRSSWSRTPEQGMGSGPVYKPPRYDANAPDMYVPLMASSTYILLWALLKGMEGDFSPDSMPHKVSIVFFTWLFEALVFKLAFSAVATQELPSKLGFMDIMSYCGYIFVGVSLSMLLGCIWKPLYAITLIYIGVAMGIFLVKTLKRVIFAEVKHYGINPTRQNYMLLAMAAFQLPLAWWLCIRYTPKAIAAPVQQVVAQHVAAATKTEIHLDKAPVDSDGALL